MPSVAGLRSPVVLVTGDSSGIGHAVCAHLAATGRTVYGASRREPQDVPWTHLCMDITDEASIDEAVESLLHRAGRIDAVVHAAGTSFAGPLEETSIAEAQHHFDVNYFGAVRVMRAVLPAMRQQERGRLVMIGSIGGLIGLRYLGHYSASKFALDGLIESMRPEITPFGIDATVIHPGDFKTALAASQGTSAATQPGSPYYDPFQRAARFYRRAEEQARTPEVLARKIETLLDRPRLPVRLVEGTWVERLGVSAKAWLPALLFESLLGRAYGP